MQVFSKSLNQHSSHLPQFYGQPVYQSVSERSACALQRDKCDVNDSLERIHWLIEELDNHDNHRNVVYMPFNSDVAKTRVGLCMRAKGGHFEHIVW